MSLVADVIARLKAQVTDLSNRVEGAAELAAVMKAGKLPQVGPAAHVVYAGIAPNGRTEALTGHFQQPVLRMVSVLVTFRGYDKRSVRGSEGVETLIDAVIHALIDWTPNPATTGVFQVRSARPIATDQDATLYQIDFILPDHLEVIT